MVEITTEKSSSWERLAFCSNFGLSPGVKISIEKKFCESNKLMKSCDNYVYMQLLPDTC